MKINILGAAGSGVTTLGLSLSKNLKMKFIDSDVYFWEKSEKPFTIRKNPVDRNEILKNELKNANEYVIAGSIIDWGENIFPEFDLIIFLWIPNKVRIKRLIKRELNLFGLEIMNQPDRQQQFSKFIEWANDYDYCNGIANRNIKSHESWLKKQNTEILELRENFTNLQRLKKIKTFCKERFQTI